MAKKEKIKKPVSLTPAKKAYDLALSGLRASYEEYSNGHATDEDFPSPGKQLRVAKQIAKLHNRLLGKSKLDGIDLDEDL